MPQAEIPSLQSLVSQYQIESILPCSASQRLVLQAGGFGQQYALSNLQTETGQSICVDKLRRAWQQVVQTHPRLRTLIASNAETKDVFQVCIRNHAAAFAHIHWDEVDDLTAKVAKEPLPYLLPDVPMHMIQVFTGASGHVLSRFCYSSVVIDIGYLTEIHQDLTREYHVSATKQLGKTATAKPCTSSHLMNRVEKAESSIITHISANLSGAESHIMRYTNVDMPVTLGRRMIKQCSDAAVAPINTLQAVWLILLARYLDIEQPCATYATRSKNVHSGNHRQHLESFCTTHISGDTKLMEMVKDLSRQTLQDENARGLLTPATELAGKRICDSTISWQDHSTSSIEIGHTLGIRPIEASEPTGRDMVLTLVYTGTTLVSQVRTSPAVEDWLIKGMTNMFIQSLEFIVNQPLCTVGDIPACSPWDLSMMQAWNSEALPKTESCIHTLIWQKAQMYPDSPAIVAHDGLYSYSELGALTSRLAYTLHTKFAFGSEERIIMMLPHSSWAIVAMVAIMKAGSAFVPLDESTPLGRVKSIAAKASARFVVTTSANASKLTELGLRLIILDQVLVDNASSIGEKDWSNDSTGPTNLAYVIFTSGSTGEPKGCAIEHEAFCSSALVYGPAMRLGTDSRVLQFASYAFDASLVEILAGLLCGSCICVPSDDQRMNDIGQAAMQMGANWGMFTPSLASRLDLEKATCIETLVLVGEPITADVRDAYMNRVALLGGYGPSEAGPISAVVGPLRFDSHPTNIGRPTANKSWVVDKNDHDRLLPVGAVGELVLESHSLGRGYIADEERTKQVFIENPAWTRLAQLRNATETRRMYKTGDLVAFRGDGTLQYMGRKDMQIKIRGQRTELGDIETHLRSVIPADLAVEIGVPQGSQQDEKILVAFLCLGPASTIPQDLSAVNTAAQAELHKLVEHVNERLTSKLTQYMLPDAYLPLRALPVTTSGKRNRRNLQQIISSMTKQQILAWGAQPNRGRPLATDMDWQVAGLWAQVLKIEANELDLDDDFVKRGGDSLAAMRLANLCKQEGLGLSFRDIYRRSRILGDHVSLCTKRGARIRREI